MTTPKSFRTGVNTNKSRLPKHGLLRLELERQLAVALWSEATRLKHQHFVKRDIPKLTLLLALTGKVGVFERTCTHAYLYICEVTPPMKTQQTNGQTTNNAHSGTAKADKNFTQTPVGRTIHTPAPFVQLVHAVSAPYDIYGRTSCTHRNN